MPFNRTLEVRRIYFKQLRTAVLTSTSGLLTNVGMVVANPAYDSNTTNIEVLDRTAYHGTVIWYMPFLFHLYNL